MQFPRKIDVKLLDALYAENVVSRSLFQSWPKPMEEDHLNNLLLDNSATIKDQSWISFLLKTGRVYRFNNPTIDGRIFHELLNPKDYSDPRLVHKILRAFIDTPYYPLRIVHDALWVGVMRVDTISEVQLAKDFSNFKSVFLCAVTPREANEVIKALVRYGKQEFRITVEPRTEV